MLRVVTWNVLHRIHAVNWDDGVIGAHPDEPARTAGIVDWIARCAADAVCLQEVSGDLLAALREREPHVFATRYPRVPHYYRRREPPTLRDPGEYLVTVLRRPGRRLGGEAFDSDRGKGFQLVELDVASIVCTHVSWGDKHARQCRVLAEVTRDLAGPVIVCGDFNADRETCGSRLVGFEAAIPAPERPTRPRTQPSHKSETIDHVFVRGAAIEEAAVLDGGGLSDHHPVSAVIRVP